MRFLYHGYIEEYFNNLEFCCCCYHFCIYLSLKLVKKIGSGFFSQAFGSKFNICMCPYLCFIIKCHTKCIFLLLKFSETQKFLSMLNRKGKYKHICIFVTFKLAYRRTCLFITFPYLLLADCWLLYLLGIFSWLCFQLQCFPFHCAVTYFPPNIPPLNLLSSSPQDIPDSHTKNTYAIV